MSVTKVIESIEELNELKNDKGFLEIVVRGANKRYKTFYNVMLNNTSNTIDPDFAKNVVTLLSENKELNLKNMELLHNITNISQIGLLLNGLNLCATCAGFAIMYKKLDQMSEQINQQFSMIRGTLNQGQDIENSNKYNWVLSEHTNMLDCRRKGQPFSEDKMRELVDREYEVLSRLVDAYKKGIYAEQGVLIFSIFSLLAMFTVSLRIFDELYYYNNHQVIGDKDAWHLSHEKWMGVYETLSSEWFVERIQDYGCFEANLTTSEVDLYYGMLLEQVADLREDVEDNQKLIVAIKNREAFEQYKAISARDIADSIKDAFMQAGSGMDDAVIENAYQEAMQLAAMA